jgi:hypothetical protein
MKEPTTPEETLALSKLRRTDPQAYLKVVNEWIRENPKNDNAYFGRFPAIHAWRQLAQIRGDCLIRCTSAWTTGSSPVVTTEGGVGASSAPRFTCPTMREREKASSRGGIYINACMPVWARPRIKA